MDRVTKHKVEPFTWEQLQWGGKYQLLHYFGKVKQGAQKQTVAKEWLGLRELFSNEAEWKWVKILDALEEKRCKLNSSSQERIALAREVPWLGGVLTEMEQFRETHTKERVKRLKLNSEKQKEEWARMKSAELEKER